ncbi:hypothetical protein ACVWZA_000860 [Sphingomonas sp. UYAg733]
MLRNNVDAMLLGPCSPTFGETSLSRPPDCSGAMTKEAGNSPFSTSYGESACPSPFNSGWRANLQAEICVSIVTGSSRDQRTRVLGEVAALRDGKALRFKQGGDRSGLAHADLQDRGAAGRKQGPELRRDDPIIL